MRRLAAFLLLTAAPAFAQGSARVEVRDDTGAPVPYALVALVGGASQVASDSGVVQLKTKAADSLNLRVRRIGYAEFFGRVARAEGSTYVVSLRRLAATLSAVEVSARAATPLTRTGFYDRVERVQKGATVGEFITPEELDVRNASTVTRMLSGSRYARVTSLGSARGRIGALVVTGRGGCGMTILVDGQQVRGTAQDVVPGDVSTSINARGSVQGGGDASVSIDDMVDGRSVMAIEVYPSTANAPAELQRLGARGTCGIVAIWTGPRQ